MRTSSANHSYCHQYQWAGCVTRAPRVPLPGNFIQVVPADRISRRLLLYRPMSNSGWLIWTCVSFWEHVNFRKSYSITIIICFMLPTCFLPRTQNTVGDMSFSVAGPRVLNSLPADLRLEVQFGAFRRQLKTVLFSRQRPRRIVTFCFFFRAPYKYSYLLTYL